MRFSLRLTLIVSFAINTNVELCTFSNLTEPQTLSNALESNKPHPSSWFTPNLIATTIFFLATNLKISSVVNIKVDIPLRSPNPSISESNSSRLVLFAATIPSLKLCDSSTLVNQLMLSKLHSILKPIKRQNMTYSAIDIKVKVNSAVTGDLKSTGVLKTLRSTKSELLKYLRLLRKLSIPVQLLAKSVESLEALNIAKPVEVQNKVNSNADNSKQASAFSVFWGNLMQLELLPPFPPLQVLFLVSFLIQPLPILVDKLK